MPELPEVQTIVDDLNNSELIGKKIVNVALFWKKSIALPSAEIFCTQICHLKISYIERKGKFIVIKIGSLFLLIHLRMSGRLLLEKNTKAQALHERVCFSLDDGSMLKFIDQRKFGRLYLLNTPSQILNSLGVDPIRDDFSVSKLTSILNRPTKIKSLLLDQKLIAGIGNIYADEALWEAQIHPETPANLLENQQIHSLHKAIIHVLQSGIINQGTSLGEATSNFSGLHGTRGKNKTELRVYKKTGQPCSRCNTLIIRIKLNGRSTHFCCQCQKNLSKKKA